MTSFPLPRPVTASLLAGVVVLFPALGSAYVAEAATAVVRRGPAGAAAVRVQPARPPAVRRTVVVAPVRPVPAVRPWYWGRVVAGVTIGTVIAATAAAVAPTPPSPELCWFWSDSTKTKGYWDYCAPPKP